MVSQPGRDRAQVGPVWAAPDRVAPAGARVRLPGTASSPARDMVTSHRAGTASRHPAMARDTDSRPRDTRGNRAVRATPSNPVRDTHSPVRTTHTRLAKAMAIRATPGTGSQARQDTASQAVPPDTASQAVPAMAVLERPVRQRPVGQEPVGLAMASRAPVRETASRPPDPGTGSRAPRGTASQAPRGTVNRARPDMPSLARAMASRATPGTGSQAAPPDTASRAAPPDTGSQAAPPDTGSQAAPPDTGSQAAPPDTGSQAAPPDTGSQAAPPDTASRAAPERAACVMASRAPAPGTVSNPSRVSKAAMDTPRRARYTDRRAEPGPDRAGGPACGWASAAAAWPQRWRPSSFSSSSCTEPAAARTGRSPPPQRQAA